MYVNVRDVKKAFQVERRSFQARLGIGEEDSVDSVQGTPVRSQSDEEQQKSSVVLHIPTHTYR